MDDPLKDNLAGRKYMSYSAAMAVDKIAPPVYTSPVEYSILQHSILSSVRFSFSRSSGKGGQNVNKVNTKVFASIPVKALSGLGEAELAALRKHLGGRLNQADEVFVAVQDERTQERNRHIAVERLTALIAASCRVARLRKKRGPSKAAKEKRLQEKKLRSYRIRERRRGTGAMSFE